MTYSFDTIVTHAGHVHDVTDVDYGHKMTALRLVFLRLSNVDFLRNRARYGMKICRIIPVDWVRDTSWVRFPFKPR